MYAPFRVRSDRPAAGGDMRWGPEQRFHREVALGLFLLSLPGALVRGEAAVPRKPCGHRPPILGKRTKLEHVSAA